MGSPLTGVFGAVTGRLSPVPLERRRRLLDLPLTREAHAEAFATIAAFREVETGGTAMPRAPTGGLLVAAWNLERCRYPEEAVRLLRRHGVGLALLTELDIGMLRTGQVHTIGHVAAGLGQRYAYALEFLELQPMPPPPGFPAEGDENSLGFHGNGLVGALPFERPVVIRLDEVADWYIAPKGGQRRIGNRMAIAATIEFRAMRFAACSVHLESATDGAGRAVQMQRLLDALDEYAAGLPVLVGGDLNTHVGPGGHDDPAEPLFAMAKSRGYDFAVCNRAAPTTRTSYWSESEGTRQLDWFFTRGLHVSGPEVVASLTLDGTVLTDHELILLTVE
jgi:endonuclease/exonuclease/phosphatase family metal-dependent hydrolase